jgi:hypothetical protein
MSSCHPDAGLTEGLCAQAQASKPRTAALRIPTSWTNGLPVRNVAGAGCTVE